MTKKPPTFFGCVNLRLLSKEKGVIQLLLFSTHKYLAILVSVLWGGYQILEFKGGSQKLYRAWKTSLLHQGLRRAAYQVSSSADYRHKQGEILENKKKPFNLFGKDFAGLIFPTLTVKFNS